MTEGLRGLPVQSLLGYSISEVLASKLSLIAHAQFLLTSEVLTVLGQGLRSARYTSLDLPLAEPQQHASSEGVFSLLRGMRHHEVPCISWTSLHAWKDLVIEPVWFTLSRRPLQDFLDEELVQVVRCGVPTGVIRQLEVQITLSLP